ncbi:hypothetical protein EC973_007310 [Apophysomyces ossiformis]|uniref:VASt domain-containing protein n=1 Tax=Apophysomyces ossiformis TaxID=679940 RepID=A0A8H7BUE1_9FUNG|nr:hypothetical protein EC973_007310 [Apophysomyces ossiformis]
MDIWRCTRPSAALTKTPTNDSAMGKEDDTSKENDASDESDATTGSESDVEYSEDEEETDSMEKEEGTRKEISGIKPVKKSNVYLTKPTIIIEEHLQQPRQSSLGSLPFLRQVKNEVDTARRRAVSEAGARPDTQALLMNKDKSGDKTGDSATSLGSKANAGQIHEKTECECSKNGEHLPNVVMDQTYPGSVESIFNLLYNSSFYKKFLVDVEKSTDVSLGSWRKGEGSVQHVRDVSYIKPLNNAIGPKSTKCVSTEEIVELDIANSVTVVTTTQTPDVPSGGSFSVKTRLCITWAAKGQVRVLVTVLVDFTKSSWLKSTIEKASMEGQTSFYKDLDAALRKYIEAHPKEMHGGIKHARRRRKGKKGKRPTAEEPTKVHKQPEKNKLLDRAMEFVSSVTSASVGWAMENIRTPSASQLTVLCMFLMVIVNLFIASKMRDLEKKVSLMSTSDSYAKLPLASRYRRPDDNDLWNWLGRLDPDKKPKDNDDDKEGVDVPWKEKWQESQLAKRNIDQHLTDLGRMIERAEKSMEQVTNVVNQQRQRIRGEWPK